MPSAVPSTPTLLLTTFRLLYPTPTSSLPMGTGTVLIVAAEGGMPLPTGSLRLDVLDPSGDVIAMLPAQADPDGVFRTAGWTVPHRSIPGTWRVVATADGYDPTPVDLGTFEVSESTSERLLHDYGLWIDIPSFRGIVIDLVAERGDVRDGMVRLGGTLPSQHVLPEEWIEVHWRSGDFELRDSAAARRFLLDQIGDFGVKPAREIGPFEPFLYKDWPAWKARAQGFSRSIDTEWVVFYAPETAQTFAIGTTVVLPPLGPDPHAILRDGLEFHPEVEPSGVAPNPLLRLLPPPTLIRPGLGQDFTEGQGPITLEWAPVKTLGPDEYYQVAIDYNYDEGNPSIDFETDRTSLEVPADLALRPNCHVFNWRVTLMRRVGETHDGSSQGIAVSFPSLYRYFLWRPPAERPDPFPPLCPNAQY